MIEKVLPDELEKCGVDDARAVCTRVSAALANAPISDDAAAADDADEIFRRLGGG